MITPRRIFYDRSEGGNSTKFQYGSKDHPHNIENFQSPHRSQTFSHHLQLIHSPLRHGTSARVPTQTSVDDCWSWRTRSHCLRRLATIFLNLWIVLWLSRIMNMPLGGTVDTRKNYYQQTTAKPSEPTVIKSLSENPVPA